MSRIQVLPEYIANRIAAGEIIERPASVVRELLDNSIDSGAGRIELEIRGGGRSLISVSDDGSGIDYDGMLLAFERHATSKINSVEDLDSIRTLGFRGEALPSIASVARVTVESYVKEEEIGTRLQIQGGKIIGVDKAAVLPGTKIQVKDLFYNVPARKKFLRTPKTEYGHVYETFIDHALNYPRIHFIFKEDDRIVVDAPAVDRWAARVSALFGRRYLSSFLTVDLAGFSQTLNGYVSSPESMQSTARSQRLYVNGRRIRDRIVSQAVYRAYREFLSSQEHPAFILRLELPPEDVDINVHPAKAEVRFRNPQAVFDFVMSAVRDQLAGSISSSRPRREESSPRQGEVYATHDHGPGTARTESPDGSLPQYSSTAFRPETGTDETGPSPHIGQQTELRTYGASDSGWFVVGQAFNLFILVQYNDHLLIIDQHTAHERILFEEFRKLYEKRDIPRQTLMFPVPVELDPEQYAAFNEFSGLFRSMGVGVESFGKNSVLVRALPEHLAHEPPEQLIRNITDELAEVGRSDRNRAAERKMLISLSCRKAIKAGDRMEISEMNELVKTLVSGGIPSTCPHGRPIIVSLSLQELQRRFKRL